MTGTCLLSLFVLGTALLMGGCMMTNPIASLFHDEEPSPQATPHTNGEGTSPVTGSNGAGAHTKIATQLISMDIIKTSHGARLSLGADGALPYEWHSLDNPPRFLLTFPGIRMAPSLQPRVLEWPNVVGLFPSEEASHASRVEIVLRTMAHHTLHERADGLDLTIRTAPPTPSESNTGTPRHAETRPTQGIQKKATLKDVRVQHNEKGTHLYLVGSGFIPDPQTFRIHTPPRLILDFLGVTGLASGQTRSIRTIPVPSREATALHMATGPQKTRLVMDLAHAQVVFRIDREKGMPVIHLTDGKQSTMPPVATHRTHATGMGTTGTDTQDGSTLPTQHTAPTPVMPQIQTVDFTRERQDARIRIQMNTDHVTLDSQR